MIADNEYRLMDSSNVQKVPLLIKISNFVTDQY